MDELWIYAVIALAAMLVPVLIWLLRLRPRAGKGQLPLLLSGLVCGICFLIPTDIAFSGWEMLVILLGIFALLMIAHWTLWLLAAIRQREVSFGMLLIPGLMILAFGAFAVHVPSILGAVLYLICVFCRPANN